MAHSFSNQKNDLFEKIVKEFEKDDDKLFVLGGDGTLLRALDTFGLEKIPRIFAFKNGTVSFCLPFEISDLQKVFETSKFGRFKFINMFRLHLISHNKLFANEVVLRSKIFKLNTFQIRIDNSKFELNCSGICISTPLGSTGYNSSLGGPLLFLDGIILNCSAPNRCNFHTVVLSIDSEIEISTTECDCYIDGKFADTDNKFLIKKGDTYQMAVPEKYSRLDNIQKIYFEKKIDRNHRI